MSEALPSYDESFGRPLVLQQTLSISDASSVSSESPPAFSLSPITLVLAPNATLIRPVYHEALATRPLYELTSPLDGATRSVFLADIPAIARLDPCGNLPQIEKRHHLYKIFESRDGAQTHTAIDGRKTTTIDGTILRRSADGTALVATNHGDIWGNQGQLIYCARTSSGVIEWLNSKGKIVAIDHKGPDCNAPETLEILVPMSRKWLDMLVAVWIARIQQDVQGSIKGSRLTSTQAGGLGRQQNSLTKRFSLFKSWSA